MMKIMALRLLFSFFNSLAAMAAAGFWFWTGGEDFNKRGDLLMTVVMFMFIIGAGVWFASMAFSNEWGKE